MVPPEMARKALPAMPPKKRATIMVAMLRATAWRMIQMKYRVQDMRYMWRRPKNSLRGPRNIGPRLMPRTNVERPRVETMREQLNSASI
jgi:hypothetical protein